MNKYRGVCVQTGEWVFGNLIVSDDTYLIVPDFGVYCIERIIKSVTDHLVTLYAFEVDRRTICRPTGLNDKYKTAIYEWDVIQFCDRKMYVHFNEETLSWEMTDIGTPLNKVNHLMNTLQLAEVVTEYIICKKITTEVIGNIFDNPEFRMDNKQNENTSNV